MDIICTICWESLENGRIFATTCGHIFHEKCIVNWTTRSPCCPECRHETTFPMRLIHFTWQEQFETQEMQSLESLEQAGASAESAPMLAKTMSTEDMFSGCGDAERNTQEMEDPPANPLSAQKTLDIDTSQRSEDGCGVCSRFHFLLEKAIKLRNIVKDHEKAQQAGGSLSSTVSEGFKLPVLPGPKAKRKRQL
uniref:RING-type domain-containing protein n=1 Tax=Anopheles stephensi TaxID=30069 RepID=A0A182YJW6_ANOST